MAESSGLAGALAATQHSPLRVLGLPQSLSEPPPLVVGLWAPVLSVLGGGSPAK